MLKQGLPTAREKCRALFPFGNIGVSDLGITRRKSISTYPRFSRASRPKILYPIVMDAGRQVRNLSLIGFMGTGKSTIGRLVADSLHFTFLDTDSVIEARAGATIQDIFRQHGEAVFREWERRIVEELSKRSHTVIATGGGLPVQLENMNHLKSHSLVICLWASPDKIYNRVKTQTHRPLLQEGEPLEKIRQLLAAREPYYKQADVLVNTEFRSPREVAQQVIHQFHAAQRAKHEPAH